MKKVLIKILVISALIFILPSAVFASELPFQRSGEFEFKLEYEIDGTRCIMSDSFACRYMGMDEENSPKWSQTFKNGNWSGVYKLAVYNSGDDGDYIGLYIPDARYFMNGEDVWKLPQYEGYTVAYTSEEEYIKPPLIGIFDKKHNQLDKSTQELDERGFKVISWTYTKPERIFLYSPKILDIIVKISIAILVALILVAIIHLVVRAISKRRKYKKAVQQYYSDNNIDMATQTRTEVVYEYVQKEPGRMHSFFDSIAESRALRIIFSIIITWLFPVGWFLIVYPLAMACFLILGVTGEIGIEISFYALLAFAGMIFIILYVIGILVIPVSTIFAINKHAKKEGYMSEREYIISQTISIVSVIVIYVFIFAYLM